MSSDGSNGTQKEAIVDKAPAEKFHRILTAEQEKKALIIQQVWERCSDKCGNCGFDDPSKVKLVFVVPEKAGGTFQVSNLTLLCRACEMAAEAFDKNPAVSRDTPDRRLVNFYMSRELFDRIDEGILKHQGFDSKGSLFRYLMLKFVEDPSRFADMSMYEDSGENKIKVSIWVSFDVYKSFKETIFASEKTVTDSLISLVMLYEAEAEPQLSGRRNG